MKRILTVFFVTAAVAFAGVAAADEIKVGGGGAPIDNILKPVREAFEKSSGIKMNLVFTNATLAFKQMANGEIDASAAGLAYEDLLGALKKEGYEVKDPSAFTGTVIGKGTIFPVVHKDNPVKALTRDQVKGIFTGKISNWKEVGGNDSLILVVSSNQNPATVAAFRKLALDGEPYTKELVEAARFEDIRAMVAANPEAIGFGPGSMIDPTVKAVDAPEYSRPVTLVTKGKPSPAVRKLIDFIAGEGQKYVKK